MVEEKLVLHPLLQVMVVLEVEILKLMVEQ